MTSTLTINEQFAIGRLLAGVNLSYAGSRASLTIRLLSPGNARLNLLGPGANSGANLDTMFDDSEAVIVPPGDQNPAFPYYDNSYKPFAPLSLFRGYAIKGNWKLEICNASATSATLNRWVLVVPEVSDFTVHLPLIRR
jgi:subtilisin-like proprotein convertase family protein